MDIGAVFYPLLLVCALLGVMLLVGIGFSYLWLRVLGARFNTCPNCHKQDAGRIVESVVLDSQSRMEFRRHPPSRVTERTLEDRWECQYCGHQWTKTAKEIDRVAVDRSKSSEQ